MCTSLCTVHELGTECGGMYCPEVCVKPDTFNTGIHGPPYVIGACLF